MTASLVRLESGEEAACICKETFNPVCGADGKSYGNLCKAKCRRVGMRCRGPCPCRKNRKRKRKGRGRSRNRKKESRGRDGGAGVKKAKLSSSLKEKIAELLAARAAQKGTAGESQVRVLQHPSANQAKVNAFKTLLSHLIKLPPTEADPQKKEAVVPATSRRALGKEKAN